MRALEHCQTYVAHLRAEHRRLHNEVREIQNALLQAQRARGKLPDLSRRLAELHDELLKHFTEEEAGGCLDEAVSYCPSVAAQADALQNQHPALLARLAQLRDHVTQLPSVQPHDSIADEFERFAVDLLAHEAGENQIMQRAFGLTVNGEDD